MKTIGWAVMICFFWLANTQAWAQSQVVTLAYLETGLKDLTVADRQVALQMLSKELVRGTDFEISILPLSSMEEMIGLLKTAKLNYSIINSYYLRDIDRLLPFMDKPMWSIQRSHQAKEDYVLVVGNNFNYKDINSLSGRRISIHQDYLMQKFYLMYLVRKNAHLPLEKFFKVIKDTRTDSQAVLDVFFGTSDVCLVPQYIVDLAIDLNPAIKNKIKVVHHSGANFIPALVISFKGNPDNLANVVHNNLQALPETIRGQEILALFNIKTVTPTGMEALQFMLTMFNEFHQLVAKP